VTDDDLRWSLADSVDLARLRALVVVAEEGSFTRAAERLFLSQPWLSTQVRELEARAGVELLDRSGVQTVPTEAGARLLPAVRLLLRRAATASDAARRALKAGAAEALRLGAPSHTWDVPARRRILARLAELDPAIDVEIADGESRELVEAVRRGVLDAAFAVLPLDDRGLTVLVVDESGVWVHVPAGHSLARHEHLVTADLAGQRFGVWDRRVNPPVYELLYGPLRESGVVLEALPGIRLEGAREAALKRGLLSIDRASFGGRPRPIEGAVAIPLDIGNSIVTGLVARSDEPDRNGAVARLWAIARDV
jgi:DNA-binding transcriptional LysR family regulator